MRILIVEDNVKLAGSVAGGVAEEGLEPEVVGTGEAALARLTTGRVDLAIVDLGLPDLDGMDVIATTRTSGVQCPILVLTARDGVAARVAALDAGADDYLVKPFAFDELLARIRALIRRAGAPRWAPLAAGSVVLGDDLSVSAADRRVVLSPREHSLLAYLLRHAGDVVKRADILLAVFGYAFDPGTNLIDVHLSHLRRKLVGFPIAIETLRGVGFRLELR